ncbi:MAG: DNA polymerase III subunit chi [Stappiaceae bacterium]
MSEILFYHLQNQSLEQALPGLVAKCLEREWAVVIQCGSQERCQALDTHLWTFREDSFLPHGTASDDYSELQPVFITDTQDNPNSATVRFVVDRAQPPELDSYNRAVFMFDGHDQSAVSDARTHWKRLQGTDASLTYWQQNEAGRWEQKA